MLANSLSASGVSIPETPADEGEAREALAAALGQLGQLAAEVQYDTIVGAHGGRGGLAWLRERVRFALARAATVGGGAEPPAPRRASRPVVQLWRQAA